MDGHCTEGKANQYSADGYAERETGRRRRRRRRKKNSLFRVMNVGSALLEPAGLCCRRTAIGSFQ
jgi:hypothetical protein